MATPVKLSPNQILLREGEVSSSMYWVQKRTARGDQKTRKRRRCPGPHLFG
jgi:hypothetical protein